MKKKLVFDINRKRYKILAVFAIFSLIMDVVGPFNRVYAQNAGSGQTSSTGGMPSGNMVDLFTGDFSYDIPLMNVDGYPITLAYNANVSMNQEASWVGLGWTLNPGAINRELRGLPDDFDGDEVTKTLKVLPDETTGMDIGFGKAFSNDFASVPFGLTSTGFSVGAEIKLGKFENNYSGNGLNFEASPTFGIDIAPAMFGNTSLSLGASVGGSLRINSREGIGFSKNFGVNMGVGYKNDNKEVGGDVKLNASIGTTNSTRGAKTRQISGSAGAGYSTPISVSRTWIKFI